MNDKAYLILENGTVFEGKSFGASGKCICEIVFTTGMTGYIETLTDKSYFGQGVVQTFPLIGNYGTMESDKESEKPQVSAYIVKEWANEPSNFRCEGNIDAYLKKYGIIGLYGIDTRALTKIIREHGVMNGMITDDLSSYSLEEIKAYKIKNAVKSVTVENPMKYTPEKPLYKVALLDFGYKYNIAKSLKARGCDVTVLPGETSYDEIISGGFDGIMLSNGPGDPAENTEIIETLKKLTKSGLPIFGICLGHQLLALSMGFKTNKMKYGHRGANQPVKRMTDGKIFITSQNHGYAVLNESIDSTKADLLYTNVNDGTCEGLTYKNINAFSVQFHPEACSGPLDTGFLFDEFIEMMEVFKNAVK